MNIDKIRSKAQEVTIEKTAGIEYLCTCGRISPEKGYDIAIKTAQILKNKGYSFIWYFVGNGPDFQKTKNEKNSVFRFHKSVLKFLL